MGKNDHLKVGSKWVDSKNNTYEVTAVYKMHSVYQYHIKFNDRYLTEGGSTSRRLISQDTVDLMLKY